MPSDAERRVPFWGLVLLTLAADRVAKLIAVGALQGDRVVSVIGEFAQFRLVYNQGAAFGLNLGPWSRWIFLVVAVVAFYVLYRIARQASPLDTLRQYAVGFVAGGAVGNGLDRILSSRGVVDFIDVGIGQTRWPTFNVADIAVSCGAVALALSLSREDTHRAPAPTT